MLFIVALVFGCTPQKSEELITDDIQERNDLYNETITIHNEVMPKMDQIIMETGKLVEKIKNDSIQMDSVTRAGTQLKITKLEDAHEAMFAWMRKYGKMPHDSLGHEEIMKVLNESKQAIIEVKNKVDEVLK